MTNTAAPADTQKKHVRRPQAYEIGRLMPSGASIEVKWYWPPAVGYTLASSAMTRLIHRYITVVDMVPYISVIGPPCIKAIWMLVERPAQLEQMLKHNANIVNGPIFFLIFAATRVVPARCSISDDLGPSSGPL